MIASRLGSNDRDDFNVKLLFLRREDQKSFDIGSHSDLLLTVCNL